MEIKHKCIEKHLLVTAIGRSIIRLIPPLMISEADCDKAVVILRECVEELS